jgi:hypothetical protein
MSYSPSAENENGLLWVASKSTVVALAGTIPGYQSIVSVWQGAERAYRQWITRPNYQAVGARWVGPQPRVTRVSFVGTANAKSTVVWPFRIPSTVAPADREAYARRFLNGSPRSDQSVASGLGRSVSLDAVVETELPITLWDRATASSTGSTSDIGSSWDVASLAPYTAAINGPLSFWTTGNAANTLTRDQIRFGMIDQNAYGPDTRATTPDSLLGALSPDTLQIKEILTIVAVIAVPIAIAIAVSSVSSTIRGGRRMRAYR